MFYKVFLTSCNVQTDVGLLAGRLRVLILSSANVELIVQDVIRCNVSLVVEGVFCSGLGISNAPVRLPRAVAGVLVCDADVGRSIYVFLPVLVFQVGRVGPHLALRAIRRPFSGLVVATCEGTLVLVVGVIVVGGGSGERALGSGCKRFVASTPPLFFHVLLGGLLRRVLPRRARDLLFGILQVAPPRDDRDLDSLLIGLHLDFDEDLCSP